MSGLIRRHTGAATAARDDAGMTLVELQVAMVTLIILLLVVTISLTTFIDVGTEVVASYGEVDQVLPAMVPLDRLLRAEVEPAPAATVAGSPYLLPSPGFRTGAIGTNTLTFTTNTGDPNGPTLVVASEATTANPCHGCAFSTWTFTVTETAATPGTCPTSANELANPGVTLTCAYGALPAKTVVSVPGVVDNPATTPIFTYTVVDLSTNPATVTQIPAASVASKFATCAAGADDATACPPDAIQSVEIDLKVEVQGAPLTENDTVAYRLTSSSYLYAANVG